MVSQPTTSTELYNLKWNSYFPNLINCFGSHQSHETLVDVSLSCEEQFIKAHRLVLSACSGYFQKIFENHTSPNLVIVLNEVKFKNLELVIQFMYRGEVKVAEDEMPDFLALGRLLQIKGLCSLELQNKQSVISEEQNPHNGKTVQPSESERIEVSVPEERNTKPETENKETSLVAPPLPKKRKQSPTPAVNPDEKKKVIKILTPEVQDSPSHVPRPPNAFMIFANQWRKKLTVEHPEETNKEISVRLGNMWKALSQGEKDTFYKEASKAHEDHRLRYPGYYYSPKEARKTMVSLAKAQKASLNSSECDDDIIEFNQTSADSSLSGCTSRTSNGGNND